jgi:lipoate-protein ligase A
MSDEDIKDKELEDIETYVASLEREITNLTEQLGDIEIQMEELLDTYIESLRLIYSPERKKNVSKDAR